MKNTQLELKAEDNKYIRFTHSQIFHLGIKDELNSGGKITIEIEEGKLKYKNGEKPKLKRSKDAKIEIKDEDKSELKTINEIQNEEELNIIKKRKSLLKIKNEDKEKSSLEIEGKLQLVKKENSEFEIQDKLKLNRQIQTNNIINSSNLNDKSILITEGNIRNQTSLSNSSFKFVKKREDQKVIIQGYATQIKISKDNNGFFEDKNKLVKYLKLKGCIMNNNIIGNIFRYNIIYLLIIIPLIQIVLTNNNIKFIEYKFSNISWK